MTPITMAMVDRLSSQLLLEEGEFVTADGRLYSRSVAPVGRALARLIIIHGYGDHSGRYREFMHWMALRGIACHAVDLRGQGRAEARRGYVRRWDDYLRDVDAFVKRYAVEANKTPANKAPVFVLGHSHGGLLVAASGIWGTMHRYDIRGCILSSPFFASRLPSPRRKLLLACLLNPVVPWMTVKSGLQPEWFSSDPVMIEDTRRDPLCARVATPRWYLGQRAAQRRALRDARQFRLPLLVLTGGADPIADPEGAQQFIRRAGSHDKTLYHYDGFLHEILREQKRQMAFEDIVNWMQPRIGVT